MEGISRIPSHLFGIPKWEDRKYGGESLFEEIMAEDFSELKKTWAYRLKDPSILNSTKQTHIRFTMKFWNIKGT